MATIVSEFITMEQILVTSMKTIIKYLKQQKKN